MNIVFLLADQLRADALGCYGHPVVRTPHLDRIAREGVRFNSAFCQHPQCAPSRASFATGRYPHVNGCISNHVSMPDHETTFADFFRKHGYLTAAAGKTHFGATKNASGFEQSWLSEGQRSDALTPDKLGEPYKEWLKAHGYWEQAVAAYAAHGTSAYRDNFQALPTLIPFEAYIDSWVGDRASDFIAQRDPTRPFLLFAGFPNPHHPFDPPEPYASMYRPEDLPLPATYGSDLSRKPPQQLAYKRRGRAGIGSDYEKLTPDKLRRVMAYYYGCISLVDDQVGKILRALESAGILDDTLIVFTSDHGELMGDHGLLLKGTDPYPLLYDVSVRVPLLFRHPRLAAAGTQVDAQVELIDLFPTLATAAGLTPPPETQGMDIGPALRGETFAGRETVYAETGAVKMLRTREWKLVHYPWQDYGELYHLTEDPGELRNLHANPVHRPVRDRMTIALLDRLIHTEGALHGPSGRGPAYWRQSYGLPFASP